LTAIWVQPFAAARASLIELFPSSQQEVHAGAVETAILMHLAPDLVGSVPPDYVPDLSETFLNYLPFRRLAPGGIWGCPTEASAEKGAQALDAVVEATTDYVLHSFARLADIKNRAGGS
jgi:creatinine amidohydrolase